MAKKEANNQPEKKMDELLDHNYDGIEEYDNDLPNWWVWLFIVTVIFGGVYLAWLHGGLTVPFFGTGMDQYAQIEVDVAEIQALKDKSAAEKAAAASSGSGPAERGEVELVALLKDQAALASGKEVFNAKCAACHTTEGAGLVGPNMTDDYWIHGGQMVQVREIIRKGVIAKGMLAWEGVLSDEEIDNVVAFIRTLRGTNPANPKAAEGELVEFEGDFVVNAQP